MPENQKLVAGDLVYVKMPAEILKTLDDKGCLDSLPFMPEMINYCGKIFKVKYRIEKTCVESDSAVVAEFKNNDVVYLENLRCSGVSHHHCQRACMIFWKEAWLSRVSNGYVEKEPTVHDKDLLRAKLHTADAQSNYFCQSTQLEKATVGLSRNKRLTKMYSDLKHGTHSLYNIIRLVLVPVMRKIIKRFKDQHPMGTLTKTPGESLNLQPGEFVEVKSLEEIIQTLDKRGKNRGLAFEPDMKEYCGKRYKVRSRLDRMILERSGKMAEVKNTVILDDITCNCYYALGGCPRKEYQFWREIWLKRVVTISALSVQIFRDTVNHKNTQELQAFVASEEFGFIISKLI